MYIYIHTYQSLKRLGTMPRSCRMSREGRTWRGILCMLTVAANTQRWNNLLVEVPTRREEKFDQAL